MIRRLSVIALLCVLVAALGFAWIWDQNGQYVSDTGANAFTEKPLTVELLPFEEEVLLVKEPVAEFAKGEHSAAELYEWYRDDHGHLDEPSPLRVKFSVSGGKASIQEQVVEIAQSADFSDAVRFSVNEKEKHQLVYNLLPGTTYHCRVTVTLTDGETATASGSFSTKQSPRFMNIDGLRNVRDIGGAKTADGRSVKMGMVYRGVELRGVMSNTYCVTEAGEATMIDELGIRTEMDLRDVSESGDPFERMQRKNYRFFATYSEIFTKDSAKEALKSIFSDLAVEENYPVYLHCTWGRDRTGTVIFLLQSLLGLSQEACYDEWELSAFFGGASFEEEMDQFLLDIQALEGDTHQHKIENYLLSIGVTREQLDAVQRILLSE